MSVFFGGFPEDLSLGAANVEAEMKSGMLLTVKIKGSFGGMKRDVTVVLERYDGQTRFGQPTTTD